VEDSWFDFTAALIRADTSEARTLAETLAAKLTAALPEQTTVRRGSTRLLSRAKQFERVDVLLGEETFSLELVGPRAQTTRTKMVRGVVIKREELPLDRWLDALAQALSAEARQSETARVALERLLG
jgi:hypothetical protein